MQKTRLSLSEERMNNFYLKFENTHEHTKTEVNHTRGLSGRVDIYSIKAEIRQMGELTNGSNVVSKIVDIVESTFTPSAATAPSYHILYGISDISRKVVKGPEDKDGIIAVESFINSIGSESSRDKQEVVKGAEAIINEVSRSERYDGAERGVLESMTKALDEYSQSGNMHTAKIIISDLMPKMAETVKGDPIAINDTLLAFRNYNKRVQMQANNELVHIGVQLR